MRFVYVSSGAYIRVKSQIQINFTIFSGYNITLVQINTLINSFIMKTIFLLIQLHVTPLENG